MKIKKYKTASRLTPKQSKALMGKLSIIYGIQKDELLEALVIKESKNFGLIESRGIDDDFLKAI